MDILCSLFRQQGCTCAPANKCSSIVRLLPMRWVKAARLCLLMAMIAATVAGQNERSKPGESAGTPFQVALLTPGPVSDVGWNATAYDGLQLIRASLERRLH
jgi:basic membrane lipoprotein Med (substrate-binding protein (PBP1-ABC) superfamily)